MRGLSCRTDLDFARETSFLCNSETFSDAVVAGIGRFLYLFRRVKKPLVPVINPSYFLNAFVAGI